MLSWNKFVVSVSFIILRSSYEIPFLDDVFPYMFYNNKICWFLVCNYVRYDATNHDFVLMMRGVYVGAVWSF